MKKSASVVVAATLAASCATTTSPTPHSTVQFSRVVSLSQRISAEIPLWPTDPRVAFTDHSTSTTYLRSFSIGEHSGTHMNAANSFKLSGDITSYSAAERVVPAVVIDVRDACGKNRDYQLTVDDVERFESEHGRIPAGALVIMYTGWDAKWAMGSETFLGGTTEDTLHFPGFATATSTWLLEQRQIAGLGIDTHGVDPGEDKAYGTNLLMARHHKLVVECLGNLSSLPPTGATLVIAPLPLKGGAGSPADVIAFLP